MKSIEIPTGVVPFVIVNRDRLTDLKELLKWVYTVNTVPVKVIIIDNGSTYKPLIEYYIQLKKEKPDLRVVQMQFNGGARIIEQFQFLGGTQHYIYTESDIVPDENCPPDLINRLINLANKYPKIHKIGLSVRIDDLPSTFPFKDDVIKNEEIHRRNKTTDGDAYISEVTSSFAIYRKGFSDFKVRSRNLRTLEPLCARHLPWYYSIDAIPEDFNHFIVRCSNESSIGKKFLSLLKHSGRLVAPVKANRLVLNKPIPTRIVHVVEKRPEPQIQESQTDYRNIDLGYNKIVVGKTYDYRTQNGQNLVITFNGDLTVTGRDGEVGNFYMAEYRVVIEWINCLNNTIDILDFNTNLHEFTGTSIDNGDVAGTLKKSLTDLKIKDPEVKKEVDRPIYAKLFQTAPETLTVSQPRADILKIKCDEIPKFIPSLKNPKISILISGCNIPTYRKLDFIEWNKDLFEKENNVLVHIITDSVQKLPSCNWLNVIQYPKPKKGVDNNPKIINFGLKNVLNSDIIIKADIDTIFSKNGLDFIRNTVSKGRGILCRYCEIESVKQIVKTIDEWKNLDKDRTKSFFIAMHKDDWYFLRGYDSKLITSGSEDIHLYSRASSKLNIIESDHFPLYKVSSTDRDSSNKTLLNDLDELIKRPVKKAWQISDWDLSDASNKITLCMPLKSRSRRALQSIRSLVNPTTAKYFNFVVVEDQSNDMLNLKDFEFVKCVTHLVVDSGDRWNKSKLINYAIKRASSKYFCTWDADYIYPKDFLERYLRIVSKVNWKESILHIKITENKDTFKMGVPVKSGTISGGCYTFLTSNLSDIRGFDENFKMYGYEDIDLINRMLKYFHLQREEIRIPKLIFHDSHDDKIRNIGDVARNINLMKYNEDSKIFVVNEDTWGECIKEKKDRTQVVQNTVVVLGNDDSLKDINFELLKQYSTFGCDALYKWCKKSNWWPTYYGFFDEEIVSKDFDSVCDTIEKEEIEFFSKTKYLESDKLTTVILNQKVNEFSTNFEFLKDSYSEIMCCQICVSLGFKKIILVGMDLNKENDIIKLKEWKEFSEFAEDNGIEIVNCSSRSKLTMFKRSELTKELS